MITPALTRDLETTRKIVLKHLKGYRAKVYLFGSQATGKAYQYSDIDVAVLPLQKLPELTFFNIRAALEESDVIHNVDVVDLSEADEKLRKRVEKEGVLWKE